MRCFGRTKKAGWCKKSCRFLFCHHHRWQPFSLLVALLVYIGVAGGLFQDIIRPLQSQDPAFVELAQELNSIPDSLAVMAAEIHAREIPGVSEERAVLNATLARLVRAARATNSDEAIAAASRVRNNFSAFFHSPAGVELGEHAEPERRHELFRKISKDMGVLAKLCEEQGIDSFRMLPPPDEVDYSKPSYTLCWNDLIGVLISEDSLKPLSLTQEDLMLYQTRLDLPISNALRKSIDSQSESRLSSLFEGVDRTFLKESKYLVLHWREEPDGKSFLTVVFCEEPNPVFFVCINGLEVSDVQRAKLNQKAHERLRLHLAPLIDNPRMGR